MFIHLAGRWKLRDQGVICRAFAAFVLGLKAGTNFLDDDQFVIYQRSGKICFGATCLRFIQLRLAQVISILTIGRYYEEISIVRLELLQLLPFRICR